MLSSAATMRVKPDVMPFIGSGVTLHLSVPGDLDQIEQQHRPCNPGPVRTRDEDEGGGTGFEVTI